MTMNRLVLICVVLSALAAALHAAERPNVVWIVSEDNSPKLGCYGEPLARTPVLDGMAKQGVRYTNARSAAPVCAPSRCSIITARFATALGTHVDLGGRGCSLECCLGLLKVLLVFVDLRLHFLSDGC